MHLAAWLCSRVKFICHERGGVSGGLLPVLPDCRPVRVEPVRSAAGNRCYGKYCRAADIKKPPVKVVFLCLRGRKAALSGPFRLFPQRPFLFGQRGCHVDAVVEIGLSDFIRSASFFSLSCNFRFCTVNGGGAGGYALSESAERHHGKGCNSN